NDDLARERVLAVDHHRVRAADAVRARAPERQRSVLVPLDLVQRVEQPVVGVGLDLELVPPRLLAAELRVVTADLQGQGDLVPGSRGAKVRALEDLAQAFGCGGGHQYFRSMGT